jgi:hypothetical protein
MLRAFNSFQMVAMFAAFPFGISWLSDQTFRFATTGVWVACLIYMVTFIVMCVSVFHGLDPKKW